MPRDGSGIYSIPPGTQGAPDTTIESAKYNAYIADVETDLNAPRPVIAGGTGGNSPAAARDNIDAERSMQVVTNYDSMAWEPGSFFSAIGATGAPNALHAFAGIVYGPDQNNLVIEARDLGDPETPGKKYVKEKTAGVWAPTWVSDGSDKVSKAGDIMTGNLTIQKATPILALDRTDATPTAIQGLRGGLTRWQIVPGDNIAEAGANAGSNFLIANSNDAGVQIETPLVINRATGIVTAKGLPSYAEAQALTTAQREQARKNIYAAPFDAIGWQNLLVNGSLDVLQEFGLNTSVNIAAGGLSYVADQWGVYANGTVGIGAAVTAYQVPGAFGASKMLGMTCQGNANIAAAGSYQVFQGIEGSRCARLNWGTGLGVPLSVCMMIFSNIAGTAVLAIRNGATNRSYCAPITINNPGTFEWKTVTIPPDSDNSGWYWDNRAGMYLSITFGVGANLMAPTPNAWLTGNYLGLPGGTNFFATNGNTMRILAIGAYPGVVAPPDVYQYASLMRDLPVETALARRYYTKFSTYHRFPSTAQSFTSDFTMLFSVEMRDAPTMTIIPGTLNIVNTSSWPFVAALDRFSFRHELQANAVGDCFATGNTVIAASRM